MSDTSLVFNLVARDRASAEVSAMGERFNTAAATIGAGFAALLGASVVQGLDMEAAGAKLSAQLQLGPAEAAEVAQVSASVYKDAWGETIDEVNLAVKGVYANIGDTSQAEGGLEGLTSKTLALAKTFDQDLTMATAAAGQMVRTGLADDADEALDILAIGLGTAADKSGDLLETFNEYSTQFRRVGLDGQTATGLIAQGLQNGARDADQVADAIGIFGETALKGGTAVDAAYTSIGLSADTMAKKIGQGGSSAEEALSMTLDALRGTTNEQVRLNAASALFGDPANTMGDALYALDPAAAAAAAGMDKTDGAMDRLMSSMGGTSKAQLEQFKRTVMVELGEASGALISFASENSAVTKPVLIGFVTLAAVVVTAKVAMFTYATVASIVTGAHTLIAASCWTVIGNWTRMTAIGLMAYARIAGAAVVSAATTAGAWMGSALVSIGTWIAAVVRAAVTAAAQFLMMAARAVAWAAVMAAQWLIAMGPIGWIIAAVIALVVLIVANWDKIKSATGAAWTWVWSKVKAVGAAILGYITNLPLVKWFLQHWDKIKTGVATKVVGLVAYVRGLPGRIRDALGSLGSLLVQKGRNVVEGLWQGIQAMGGWLKSKVMSFARNAIPGPIAKALGIASPSKVTTAQGRWIARGLVVGLTGSAKQVKSAAQKLADIVRDSMAPGKKRSAALDKIGAGSKRLVALANAEVRVAARMKTATKALSDQLKARDKLAADVKKGVLDSANITAGATGGPVTAQTILATLTQKMQQARQFAAQLATLRKKGVRSDLIAQIAQAGVEQGSGAATALALASKSQISQINATQGALVGAAGQAGATAGTAMYGAGIQAARGLVKGLKSQQKAIEKQMASLAKGMAASIKKALGIHSPSTLMADEVGAMIPAGIITGMADGQAPLDKAMANSVKPPPPPGAGGPMLSRPAAPLLMAGGGGQTVRIELVGPEEGKRFIRGIVRKDGRGSVQKAFGYGKEATA
ncbi:phage tail tape measure protein [Streptomyces sp. NPDC058620]|uniref:phage tail tape measure protein n=1 Tax=Streptomyces sp. NPDC058620 TaxID=3346560 RepID=UPI00364B24BF